MNEALVGDSAGVGVVRIPLRSPTLPPATDTNCYLVGSADFYVVEPASPYADEQRRLEHAVRHRIALGHRVLGVIVTHHHRDHVGGVTEVCETFDVPLLAHPATLARLDSKPSRVVELREGDALDDALSTLDLAVLHTPGHAPGHLCLHSRAHGWAIVGDMIASEGTILIDLSDDGDMNDYLTELGRLRSLAPSRLLPAHGGPIDEAVARLEFYIAHRLAREARVYGAVGEAPTELDAVVSAAYADTPGAHPELARRSALAHLDRLAKLRRVAREGERWRRVT